MSLRFRSARRIDVFFLVVPFALFAAGCTTRPSQPGTSAAQPPALASAGHTSGAEPAQRGLSEPARKYIWECEQKAFQLNHKTAPQLATLLEAEDRAGLLEFFADRFQGQVFAADSVTSVRRSFGEFRFQRESEQAKSQVSREGFVDWLLGFVRGYSSTPRVELGLLFLSPVDRANLDGAWEGTWIIRISGRLGERDPASTPQSDRVGYFPPRRTVRDGQPCEAFIRGTFGWEKPPADFRKDRGWITHWMIQSTSVARTTHVLMNDVTASSGIDTSELHDNWTATRAEFRATSGGVYACDYNGDGNTDLLITDRMQVRLYMGLGSGTFEDVTLASGIPTDSPGSVSVVLADLDNDGDEDLVLGTAAHENRGGTFVRRGFLSGSENSSGFTVADYDRDGLVDLYAGYSAPPPQPGTPGVAWIGDESGLPNRLYRNRGNFQFEDVTDKANAGAGRRSTFSSVWLDADDDAWPDLYVINELGNNVLLRNEHNGTFSEHHVGPAHDGFAMGIAAGDVDGDGRIDLYVGNMLSKAGQRVVANVPPGSYPETMMQQMRSFVSGNLLLVNRGNLRFDDSGISPLAGGGWSYGPALLDLDNDGLLDIHTTCGFASFSRSEPDG